MKVFETATILRYALNMKHASITSYQDTTILIDERLLDEARALSIDISAACNAGLSKVIADARIERNQQPDINQIFPKIDQNLPRYTADIRYSPDCKTGLRLSNHRNVISNGLDWELPGIYMWEIEGIGKYIGRYTAKRRPFNEYCNNIRKICQKQPYRPQKPDKFRLIHKALHNAMHDGHSITLSLLENVRRDALSEREKYWLHLINPNLNG